MSRTGRSGHDRCRERAVADVEPRSTDALAAVSRLAVGRPAARAPGAQRPSPALRVAHREGRLGDSGDVLRGTLRTFNLDPPMILVLVDRGALGGPGQARFAGAGRVAPARTLRVRRREGRFRDVSGCLKGAPQDAHRPEGHPQDIKPRPQNAPHKPHAARPVRKAAPLKAGPSARRARPQGGPCPPDLARRALPAGACGRAGPREKHRWIQVECSQRPPFRDMAGVANAPFAASGHCRGRFAPAREAGRTVTTVPHDQPRKTPTSDHQGNVHNHSFLTFSLGSCCLHQRCVSVHIQAGTRRQR